MKIIVMNCRKGMTQKKRESQENKSLVSQLKMHTPAAQKRVQQFEILREVVSGSFAQLDANLLKFRKYRFLISIAYSAFLLFLPGVPAFAAAGADGGVAILKLMQMASFWVGIAVVVWGIVEAQLDLPGWKGRIFKGIGGYIAILLVPMLFITLRDNLQIDVWQQLKK